MADTKRYQVHDATMGAGTGWTLVDTFHGQVLGQYLGGQGEPGELALVDWCNALNTHFDSLSLEEHLDEMFTDLAEAQQTPRAICPDCGLQCRPGEEYCDQCIARRAGRLEMSPEEALRVAMLPYDGSIPSPYPCHFCHMPITASGRICTHCGKEQPETREDPLEAWNNTVPPEAEQAMWEQRKREREEETFSQTNTGNPVTLVPVDGHHYTPSCAEGNHEQCGQERECECPCHAPW